jgi:hypothetical protein
MVLAEEKILKSSRQQQYTQSALGCEVGIFNYILS